MLDVMVHTVVMTAEAEGRHDDIFDLGFVDDSISIRVVHGKNPAGRHRKGFVIGFGLQTAVRSFVVRLEYLIKFYFIFYAYHRSFSDRVPRDRDDMAKTISLKKKAKSGSSFYHKGLFLFVCVRHAEHWRKMTPKGMPLKPLKC